MKPLSPSTQQADPASPSPSVKKPITSWIVTGVLLIVAGIAMIPTMFLAAIGGGFILGGIAVITSAMLRMSQREDG